MIHRPGRDTILRGMGLALNSKHNSDQQLLSSADCRQTRHALDYSIGSRGHRGVRMAAVLLLAVLYFHRDEVLLDEGHPLLVLAVAFVVLFLLPCLAGLCAVVGHLQFNRGRDGGYVPTPSSSLSIRQSIVGWTSFTVFIPTGESASEEPFYTLY